LMILIIFHGVFAKPLVFRPKITGPSKRNNGV
jgi:hypothetical protein